MPTKIVASKRPEVAHARCVKHSALLCGSPEEVDAAIDQIRSINDAKEVIRVLAQALALSVQGKL